MRVAIIGTGYVGLVSGACLADLGHTVICIDSDADKIARLTQGVSPLYEPGLDEVIERNAQAGRLRFGTSIETGAREADIAFIAVGTPASEHDGLPDLTQLQAAFAPLARAVHDGALIVVKSTVPVGTTRQLGQQMASFRPGSGILVASNPEFLRQGSAIEDFMKPDRLVIGIDNRRAAALLGELYAPLMQSGVPMVATTFESAELIKYAANTMLAARVAFINEMADICEEVGANIRDVARGVGLDHRIGHTFLQPGPGFGGSCFPKDTLALQGIARTHAVPAPLVDAVIASNIQRRHRMVEKITAACGGSLNDKTLAILGLTFKPGTDDLRESVSLVILPALLAQGARLRAYDPQGMVAAKSLLEGDIAWCRDAYEAAEQVDACVILTEWNEFKSLDLARLRERMRTPLVVDLRNIYKRKRMLEAGFRYVSIGRAEVSPEQPDAIDMTPQEEEAA